jgi:hypothetical protein
MMSDRTIYPSETYEWAISHNTDFVAIQPAPLAVMGNDEESFEGHRAVLEELGLKRLLIGVKPPAVQGVC